MASVEIDNFVKKFKQLCFSGIPATLNFESKNGKTFVNLGAEIDIKAPIEDKPVALGSFLSNAYSRTNANIRESKNVESYAAEQALNDSDENPKDSNSGKLVETHDAILVPDSEVNMMMD